MGSRLFFGILTGSDGFIIGVISVLYSLCFIPVIPLCILYDICYLLRKRIPALNKIPLKKYIITCVCIGAAVSGAILIYNHEYEIREAVDSIEAHIMMKRADAQFTFNESTFNTGGILGFDDMSHDTVLIDIDSQRVGIIKGWPDESFIKIDLEKTADPDRAERIRESCILQRCEVIDGISFESFSPDKDNLHRTCAIIVTGNDGTVYCTEGLQDEFHADSALFTGLYR